MAEPEKLRSKDLRETLGPRYWREGSLERKDVIVPWMTKQEAIEGRDRAFNKCQLAYDKYGRKYRTDIPRPMPRDDFDFTSKKKGKQDGEVY